MPTGVERLVGRQVARIRRERDLTQAQLAELVDVATETISRLERGVSIPSLKTLENIGRTLNVPLKDLFDFEYPEKSKETSSEKELSKVITLLKPMKAEDIRVGYTVLKSVFGAIKGTYRLKR